jgi:hypothetical protein
MNPSPRRGRLRKRGISIPCFIQKTIGAVEYDSSAMTPKWMAIIDQMKGKGIDFVRALTNADVVSIESKFSFRFPPDLRAFLQTAVPRGEQFPDWHSGSEAHSSRMARYPTRGRTLRHRAQQFLAHRMGTETGIDQRDIAMRGKVAVSRAKAHSDLCTPHDAGRPAPREKSCFLGPPNRHHLLRLRSRRLSAP